VQFECCPIRLDLFRKVLAIASDLAGKRRKSAMRGAVQLRTQSRGLLDFVDMIRDAGANLE